MKLPRNLDGSVLVRHLVRMWDYRVDRQRGSHILLVSDTPVRHSVPVPDHRPLRPGTLHDILGQVAFAKGVDRDDVLIGL